jgi:16S rRNA (cytosine967-C5)-methyltransferase
MIAPARVAAYEILMAVSAGRTDLPAAIAHARRSLADERDKALAADIATGVQRWRAALDHLIVTFSKRRLDRLDAEVVAVLRLSLYQLLHLTRVPAAAVVDDAVDLAGKAGKRSASGLVNAVLRAASRKRASLPWPPRPADPSDRGAALDYLSVTLSHPRWLVERWLTRFGFDVTESWLRFNNTPAPLTIRTNTLALTTDELRARLLERGIVTTLGRFAPDALVVQSGNPLRDASAGADWFVVQDEASQLVTLLAGPSPGARVLDTCAAPGGKTTALAALVGDRGRVVACDVRDRRMALLKHTVHRLGARHVWLVQADLRASLPFTARFDCVVVDAPCSGLGTLRRDPDIRWRRLPADLLPLADAQTQMLTNAAQHVTSGGRLVYATCSSEPEENEEVVDRFLARSPAFRAVDARTVHPRLAPELVDGRGHFRTSPDRHGLEAFFGAVFERAAG